MIKKQLLCCGVVTVLVLLSKLHTYHEAANAQASTASMRDSSSQDEWWLDDIDHIRNTAHYASLRFANEPLPLGDKQIERKMMRFLREYAHVRRRTQLLHHQAIHALPKVAAILRRHGVPEDFKYVPLVESGYRNGTTSHRGASGYWQFMPATARAFGLRVDEEVDERQDIEKSTAAAARYLKTLYREFNSWTLVAAAYNAGEGALLQAINRQREDNYFRLKLNRETGNYVYKLISVKEVVENPGRYLNPKNRTLLADAAESSGTNASL